MLQTKAEEQYQINGVNYVGILFIRLNDVFFRLRDKMIVIYLEKGYLSTLTDEATNEEITKYNVLANMPLSYTQDEIKALLDGSEIIFNASGDNLLIDEMDAAGLQIIKDLITADSSQFFGVDISEWKEA